MLIVLAAGGKEVEERVILANDPISTRPFAHGSLVQGGSPWSCALCTVWVHPRGGLWLGWSSASP